MSFVYHGRLRVIAIVWQAPALSLILYLLLLLTWLLKNILFLQDTDIPLAEIPSIAHLIIHSFLHYAFKTI